MPCRCINKTRNLQFWQKYPQPRAWGGCSQGGPSIVNSKGTSAAFHPKTNVPRREDTPTGHGSAALSLVPCAKSPQRAQQRGQAEPLPSPNDKHRWDRSPCELQQVSIPGWELLGPPGTPLTLRASVSRMSRQAVTATSCYSRLEKEAERKSATRGLGAAGLPITAKSGQGAIFSPERAVFIVSALGGEEGLPLRFLLRHRQRPKRSHGELRAAAGRGKNRGVGSAPGWPQGAGRGGGGGDPRILSAPSRG